MVGGWPEATMKRHSSVLDRAPFITFFRENFGRQKMQEESLIQHFLYNTYFPNNVESVNEAVNGLWMA